MRRARARPLDGKAALVTGASSGIGAAVATELARRGVLARLVLAARREDRLEQLAATLRAAHPDCTPVVRAVDLADADAVSTLCELAAGVDVLVNNAGFGWGAPYTAQLAEDPGRLLAMVDVNCRALLALCGAAVPGMVQRSQGWVLNVGSIAGRVPSPSMTVYGATKAFVASYTEALRVELRGTGVAVHLLAPGPVLTEFFEVARPGQPRPPEALFLTPERVARETVDALLADRPRLVPGLPVRLLTDVLASLPMMAYRPLAGVGARLRSGGARPTPVPPPPSRGTP